jgi:hypothetical protein
MGGDGGNSSSIPVSSSLLSRSCKYRSKSPSTAHVQHVALRAERLNIFVDPLEKADIRILKPVLVSSFVIVRPIIFPPAWQLDLNNVLHSRHR